MDRTTPESSLRLPNKGKFIALLPAVWRLSPLDVELVASKEQRQLFCELLSRYHYLGYAMPYGARVKTVLVYPLVKNAARRLADGR